MRFFNIFLASPPAAAASFLFFIRTVRRATISFVIAALAGLAGFVLSAARAGGTIGGATAFFAGAFAATTLGFRFLLLFLRLLRPRGGNAKNRENKRAA